MSHIVRRPAWGVASLNTDTGHVLVQEEWRYNWTVVPPASAWTLQQRRRFHNTADRQIWRAWSGRLRFRVAGANPVVRRFPHELPPVDFDIRWVLSGGQLTVNVRKLPSGSSPTTFMSEVDFAARVIHLDSADLASYRPINAAGQRGSVYALPHEFGHTMGDPAGIGNPDEYTAGSAHLADTDSIMNIGRQVRARHLTALQAELNAMLPDCTFST
ncbi:hypothetical protein [Sorangium sp. So ce362]|uniref:hypothetical protein n=1 Tax=Sorangium sp. So ce362 TaxID=3133303 RepID=UPI003F5D60F3